MWDKLWQMCMTGDCSFKLTPDIGTNWQTPAQIISATSFKLHTNLSSIQTVSQHNHLLKLNFPYLHYASSLLEALRLYVGLC